MSIAQDKSGTGPVAYIVMALTPLFFSTNLIFGRGVSGDVAPFTLAFLRWLAVAIVLFPLLWQARTQIQAISTSGFGRICVLGFLGMWVCGALVYVALDYTTATNATLIYTTSSVMIILIEFLFYGRKSNWREAVGIVMAMAGIVVIVVKGSLELLLSLTFNPGDLIILISALSWAVYSVLQRRGEVASIPTLPALALISAVGAVWLLPFAIWEFSSGQEMPETRHAWGSIAGIIVFASLLAFSGFQFGVRHLGAPVAGIFMYMLPVYGVALAMIFLGERLEFYHLAGAALVMGGIVSATLPMRLT
ncbi:MAG: DMT family transporter [Rhizobiaceae bacterium]